MGGSANFSLVRLGYGLGYDPLGTDPIVPIWGHGLGDSWGRAID